MRLGFKLEAVASGSRARAGRFKTLHNEVLTPLFMPVGTNASVRNQNFPALRSSGSQILLANTYHLMQRPGPQVLERLGGVHGFTGWERSVLTDSGGFQVFSLSENTRVTDEGVTFRPGPTIPPVFMNPEISMKMQASIGSDIRMAFDQCVPSTCDRTLAEEAMHRTHRWAKLSLEAHGSQPASLFGIVQGACYPDLRKQSADFLTQLPFDGFAIGGLAVGETKQEREDFTELTAALLPANLPRYLMGVGTPIDLLEAVHRGVDMFDCILPVALAQQGVSYTFQGRVDMVRGVYEFWDGPIDEDCACDTCANYSRAYLRHLIKAKEPLGWQLIGAHNLWFYHQMMRQIRQSILENRFAEYYRNHRERIAGKDEEAPVVLPKRGRSKPQKPIKMGDYEVIRGEGTPARIRQISSGEVMHSVSDPMIEARRLYIEQARLIERIGQPSGEPLRIWDVGLGAAANLMAAVECIEAHPNDSRSVEIISFENDLDSLKLALANNDLFPYLRHAAPVSLLESGSWNSKKAPLRCVLRHGDFLRSIDGPAPDLIFYDPFSFKSDHVLWSVETFSKIARHCAEHSTELFTYSASTGVRSRLLAGGWYVARGVPTGPKNETTIALTAQASRSTRFELLGLSWLEKWNRSGARDASLDAPVTKHPQFSECGSQNPSRT